MDEMAEIIREQYDGGGSYSMAVEGALRPAILTWKAVGADGDVRLVDHTFTPPEARGKGLAAMLVQAIVDDAREQGFKIAPQCPYVVYKFGKNPDWGDLRADLPR